MALVDHKRETIHQTVDNLSLESLQELERFIEYLRFREQHGDSSWLKVMVEGFSDVQNAVDESGMSEEEVNQMIADAVDEVRRAEG